MWKKSNGCKEVVCQAQLVDGTIVEYDMAVSVDYFVRYGCRLKDYSEDFTFLGEGKIYSVDGHIQSMKSKANNLFFKYA